MKEESRIEALEHELKILKNEIQTTLLEIREQILNHYYPELRAEEPLHHHSLPVRPAVGRPGLPPAAMTSSQQEPVTLSEIAAKGQIQPFSDIFLEDLDDDDSMDGEPLVNSRRPAPDDLDDLEELDEYDDYDDDDDDMTSGIAVRELKVQQVATGPKNPGTASPKTREVNFRQLKQSGTALPSAAPAAKAVQTPHRDEAAPVSKPSLPNLTALTKWANEGVATVGKERTLEVIDTYTTGGKLSGAARTALQKIVGRAEDIERESPVGSREMLVLMVALDQVLDQ